MHETDVPEAVPTLDRLRAEFTRLGSQEVNSDDCVLIYYSGHGTQCIVADSSGRRFSREALLPKDKVRGIERRFLFDWELNALIARIAARTQAVTVVLDCCSSAGVTRGDLDAPDAQDRFFATTDEYQLGPCEAGPGDGVRGVSVAAGRVSRCQVVAACRDDERARESTGDGDRAHGELTRTLVKQLAAVPPADLSELRWGRVWRTVEAEVRALSPRQNPWLCGSFGRRVFGIGGDDEGDPGFAVSVVGDRYRLDAGTLAGVTEEAEIAVYGAMPPAFPPLGGPEDLAARKGLLRVIRATGRRARRSLCRRSPCRRGLEAACRRPVAPHASRGPRAPRRRARRPARGLIVRRAGDWPRRRTHAGAAIRRRLGPNRRHPRDRRGRRRARTGDDPRRPDRGRAQP